MFCNNCGANVSDSAYCSNCGRPLPKAPSVQATAGQTGAATGAAPAPSADSATQASPSAVPVSPWLNVPAAANAGQPQTDGKAVASLVFGILSILPLPVVASIPAVIIGHVSRASIRNSMGRLKGEGIAAAGLAMGYVSLVCAAILFALVGIPNLYRAKLAANDAAAASTVRTLNTAQVTYSTTYPARGYARDLAMLGPGDSASCTEPSDAHACFIDRSLGGSHCAAGAWCTPKGGFYYSLTGVCGDSGMCTDYIVVGSPISDNTGSKSFCSTSDSIIRQHSGRISAPLTKPEECLAWRPV
jgi:type IV pilus assembly protein PilA